MNLGVLGQFGDLDLGVEFFREIDEIMAFLSSKMQELDENLAFLSSKMLEFHQFFGKIDAIICSKL